MVRIKSHKCCICKEQLFVRTDLCFFFNCSWKQEGFKLHTHSSCTVEFLLMIYYQMLNFMSFGSGKALPLKALTIQTLNKVSEELPYL